MTLADIYGRTPFPLSPKKPAWARNWPLFWQCFVYKYPSSHSSFRQVLSGNGDWVEHQGGRLRLRLPMAAALGPEHALGFLPMQFLVSHCTTFMPRCIRTRKWPSRHPNYVSTAQRALSLSRFAMTFTNTRFPLKCRDHLEETKLSIQASKGWGSQLVLIPAPCSSLSQPRKCPICLGIREILVCHCHP